MSSELPLVSIVIPTYNHAHLLRRALNSVIGQTYGNWEATVIDNHSRDNTEEVVSEFQDNRIKLVKYSNHGVIAASRNAGVRQSKGEWIAFLDSDDWWTHDKLQLCLDAASADTNMVYHDMEIVGVKSLGIFKRRIKSRQLGRCATIDLLVHGNPIATSSVVVRKKLLESVGGMNESPAMTAAEDYHTWLLISRQPGQLKYLAKGLGYYLVHAQGVSRKDMSGPMRAAMSDFLPLLDKRQRHAAFARIIYARARSRFLRGQYSSIMQHLCYCLRFGDYEIRLKALAMALTVTVKKTRK
ncbi:MAG: glycosyltransferase family 2 protein [Pseudomonadota bacterium]